MLRTSAPLIGALGLTNPTIDEGQTLVSQRPWRLRRTTDILILEIAIRSTGLVRKLITSTSHVVFMIQIYDGGWVSKYLLLPQGLGRAHWGIEMRNLCVVISLLLLAADPRDLSAEEGPADSVAPTAEHFHYRTGWYIGEHAGYSWGKSKIAYDQDPRFGNLFGDSSFGDQVFNNDLQPNSATGGIQAGYDHQVGALVYGLVADFDYRRGTDQSQYFVPSFLGSTLKFSTKQNWHGTLRGRIGFHPSDAWLVYTTGGLAYSSVEHTVMQVLTVVGTDILRPFSSSRNKIGWTVGTGAEYQFSETWSVGIEYLYADLGTDTFGAGPGTGRPDVGGGDLFPRTKVSYNDAYHVARVMLNYRFGGSQ